MRTAPVVIVPMSDKGAYLDRYSESDKTAPDWPVPYWHMDTAMAALLILQTAVDEGLGACFFGVPGARIDAFREAFGVPANLKPIGAITVGHRVADTGSARLAGPPLASYERGPPRPLYDLSLTEDSGPRVRQASPARIARIAACTRSRLPVLSSTLLTWVFTVLIDRCSRSAISPLVRPGADEGEHVGLPRRQCVRRQVGRASQRHRDARASSTAPVTAGERIESPAATARTAATSSAPLHRLSRKPRAPAAIASIT